jgi:hypothetical protein
VYVDDLLVVSPTESQAKHFIDTAKQRFIVTDLGVPSSFLGIQIHRDSARRKLALVQTSMIEGLMRRYNLIPKVVTTPMDYDSKLVAADDADTKPDPSVFRSKVGSVMYIQTSTRPDIAFAVKELSRYLSNPSWAHMRAVDRLLHYLHIQLGMSASHLTGLCHHSWCPTQMLTGLVKLIIDAQHLVVSTCFTGLLLPGHLVSSVLLHSARPKLNMSP